MFPLTDTTTILTVLLALLGLIFWLSTLAPLKRFFEFLPPVIWAYFLPMFGTTFGLLPEAHPLYGWMSNYLLLIALFLLMITVDIPAILRLGKMALIMMLVGTAGIVIGGPIAFLIFKGLLPADAWQGMAALSGSWIGGTANMVAIQQAVGAPDAALGPIIVVDTVVGYGWMGVLIFLSAFQTRFDRWVKADTRFIQDLNTKLAALDTTRRPTNLGDIAILLGLGFAATLFALYLGRNVPTPTLNDTAIISAKTWAILIVVTLGLALSFTRLRQMEQVGASRFGYFALYLLLTSIGARANLTAVLDAPYFLLAGVVWISIHVGLLMLAAKWLGAPLFFVATGSMANVGGAASAPIVAGVYLPAMAPVGLLMAVAGYIVGIYAGLFGTALIFEWLGTM